MNRTGALIAISVPVILCVALWGVWLASPYAYASALVTAVETEDAEKLGRIADIYLIQQDMRETITENMPAMAREVEKFVSQGSLGKMVVERAKGFLVDKLVNPKTLASLLRGNGVVPPELVARIPPDRLIRRTMVSDKSYGPAVDLFYIRFRAKETGEEALVVLSRDGWFVWRAVAVRLSSTSLLFPFSLKAKL